MQFSGEPTKSAQEPTKSPTVSRFSPRIDSHSSDPSRLSSPFYRSVRTRPEERPHHQTARKIATKQPHPNPPNHKKYSRFARLLPSPLQSNPRKSMGRRRKRRWGEKTWTLLRPVMKIPLEACTAGVVTSAPCSPRARTQLRGGCGLGDQR